METQMNVDRGRERVKNPKTIVDIICTWPLMPNNLEVFLSSSQLVEVSKIQLTESYLARSCWLGLTKQDPVKWVLLSKIQSPGSY